jgi:NAD(P)-dependent dehydrogenase (short-subunit alcohol dehydrogenase family)
MVGETVSAFGHLDAAFNNAGVQSPAVETADAGGDEFDRVNAINLRGVWSCMKYEAFVTTPQPPDATRRPASSAGRCRPSAGPRVRSVNGPQDSEQPR